MCYDGFKGNHKNLSLTFLKNSFDFYSLNNIDTGHQIPNYDLANIKANKYFKYGLNLKYFFKTKSFWINGSIHKFWKDNNYGIFTFEESRKAFLRLFKIIGGKPEEMSLSNLEYSLNLPVSFNPDIYLKRLIVFKSKEFNKLGRRDGIGKYCEFTEYIIKIYNKGREYDLPYYVLRIEKKVTDSKHLRKFGIKTVADLLDKEKCKALLEDLLKCFDDILLDDISIDETKLTTNQKLALAKYRNPKFWIELDKETRRNSKQRFMNYIREFGKENLSIEVKEVAKNTIQKILAKDAPFRKSSCK